MSTANAVVQELLLFAVVRLESVSYAAAASKDYSHASDVNEFCCGQAVSNAYF